MGGECCDVETERDPSREGREAVQTGPHPSLGHVQPLAGYVCACVDVEYSLLYSTSTHIHTVWNTNCKCIYTHYESVIYTVFSVYLVKQLNTHTHTHTHTHSLSLSLSGTISTDFNVELRTCDCFSPTTVKTGKELRIFYGARSNTELFLHQGFVYPPNTADTLRIKMGENKPWSLVSTSQ